MLWTWSLSAALKKLPYPTRRQSARRRHAAIVVALVVGAAPPGALAQEAGAPTAPESSRAGPVLDYSTEILGLNNEPELLATLQQTSRLISLQDQPPATRAGLSRRAESDLDSFAKVLRSEGFFRPEVTFAIDVSGSPARVDVSVDTGPLYLLSDYAITYQPEAPDLPADIEELGLHIGMRAQSAPIVDAQAQLLGDLARLGHPLASVIDRTATVDHEQTLLSVDLRIDPGPRVTFGEVTITGLKSVDARFIRRRIPWQRGMPWDQQQIDALRDTLDASQLFINLAIVPAATPDPDGSLPINVNVREGKRRSIGVGANYSTSEGAEAITFWEHRNLFGSGERLRISATIGEIQQKAAARFRLPGFGRLDQDFVSSIEAGREDTDAFRSVGVDTSAGIERRIGDNWQVFAGGLLDFSEVEDDDGTAQTKLIGTPVRVTRDTTDDLLDATSGTRITVGTTPLFGRHRGQVSFLVNEVNAAAFLSVPKQDRVVLAGRLRLGSIVGESTGNIPADRRFFAGGGGSVRGYELQSVGPLDTDGDPIGGRSVVEVGLEARLRLTDTIGIVPFVEGGQVFDDSIPDFSQEPLWAAGLGLRYFTAVGPIRLDVATPINGRSRDDSFQFYISIGQAF